MKFEIVGEIKQARTFATGSGIREIARLRKVYGRGRWRKRKGFATIRFENGIEREAEITGTRPPASEKENLRSSDSLTSSMKEESITFVICIDNTDYPASLEKRKIYESVSDSDAEQLGQIRVIDESGEDYLYPKELFVEANLPDEARSAIIDAA